MRTLVLASTSRYRRDLLARLGLPFEVQDPGVDEHRPTGEPVAESVVRLAQAKARAVAARYPRALVIGADQLSARDGRVSGKPLTREAAIATLLDASGGTVDFYTGLALLDTEDGRLRTHVAHNRVHFRALSRAAVEEYVDRERPLDCAGAFRCEGLGIALFERIEGDDPNALIGLPLIALTTLLGDAGQPVLGSNVSA